jgi:putative tryptophan/tyrosine transport system substrate-binding protein
MLGTAMQRREFITLIGGTALSWPIAARALQPATPVIGFLGSSSASQWEPFANAFKQGVLEQGYVEGKNIAFEFRWARNQYDQLPKLAAELIHINVAVLVTHGTPGALAAKAATATIPIVLATSGDAVALGIVSSLARPAGNITGSTFFNPELMGKRLEVLHEVAPSITQVAVLLLADNPLNPPMIEAMRHTAKALHINLHQTEIRRSNDLDEVFSAMVKTGVEAVVVHENPLLQSIVDQVATIATSKRLLSVGSIELAQAGGLISYGVDLLQMYRRAGYFVDKILKGSKPADLPVEQPARFKLFFNLKTAKSLGLDIPPTLLARADEVIE